MSLTLEQLDQFGSLDSLPFSLDNNWTDEGVCGPFTLEGLDPFGSIDSLGFSLDDNIWNLSTTTCAKDGLSRGNRNRHTYRDCGFSPAHIYR
jgi:hypothetical protein